MRKGENEKTNSLTPWLVGATMLELSQDDLIGIGITVLGQYKKLLREREASSSPSSRGGLQSLNGSANVPIDDEDMILASEVELVKKLGGGHFGKQEDCNQATPVF